MQAAVSLGCGSCEVQAHPVRNTAVSEARMRRMMLSRIWQYLVKCEIVRRVQIRGFYSLCALLRGPDQKPLSQYVDVAYGFVAEYGSPPGATADQTAMSKNVFFGIEHQNRTEYFLTTYLFLSI